MPAVVSEPVNATETAWLYHPFASGPRAGVGVTLGGVESYLSGNENGALTLPATSRQVPATLALPESGPAYLTTSHDAIPDVASLPANVTVTGALYQPLPLGCRSAVAPVTVGLSVSILNCRWNGIVALPSVAVQSSASLLVRKVLTAGHVVSVAPVTDIWTLTGETYQPLSPGVPDVTEYETETAASPACAKTSVASAARGIVARRRIVNPRAPRVGRGARSRAGSRSPQPRRGARAPPGAAVP